MSSACARQPDHFLQALGLGFVRGEIRPGLLDLALGGGELGGVFVVPLAKDVALRGLVGVGVGRIVDAAGKSRRRDGRRSRSRVRNLAVSSSLSASVKVGSRVASTSPALTFCPILTATERTTEVSSGWITISLSPVTILPLALTTMSTFSDRERRRHKGDEPDHQPQHDPLLGRGGQHGLEIVVDQRARHRRARRRGPHRAAGPTAS